MHDLEFILQKRIRADKVLAANDVNTAAQVKREAGANPARSRHCIPGADSEISTVSYARNGKEAVQPYQTWVVRRPALTEGSVRSFEERIRFAMFYAHF